MFIVNIPSHRGEEGRKGKRITRGREKRSKYKLEVGNQTSNFSKRDHNQSTTAFRHMIASELHFFFV